MPKLTYQSLPSLRSLTIGSGLLDEKPFAYWRYSLNKVVPSTHHMLTFSYISLALFQETIKMDGAVEKVIAKLEDEDEDVRVEAIKALLALGTQSLFFGICNLFSLSLSSLSSGYFKETLNAANGVSNLFGRLSDGYVNVRFAAVQAMSTLSSHGR